MDAEPALIDDTTPPVIPSEQLDYRRGLRPPWDSESARAAGKLGGRPISIEKYLRKVLRQRGPEGKRNAMGVAQALVDAAKSGDINALKLVLDRVDGPMVQKTITEHTERRELLIEAVPAQQQPVVLDVQPQLPAPELWTDGTD